MSLSKFHICFQSMHYLKLSIQFSFILTNDMLRNLSFSPKFLFLSKFLVPSATYLIVQKSIQLVRQVPNLFKSFIKVELSLFSKFKVIYVRMSYTYLHILMAFKLRNEYSNFTFSLHKFQSLYSRKQKQHIKKVCKLAKREDG